MLILKGHISPETAYVQPDYPYGRSLRCQRRVWIETKRGHGQRLVTQTTDPKRPYLYWNKPKAGIYSDLIALTLDDAPESATFGHVDQHVFHSYGSLEKFEAFMLAFAEGLDPERVRFYRAVMRAHEKVTVTIHNPADGPAQTQDEQRAIMRNAIGRELSALPKVGP